MDIGVRIVTATIIGETIRGWPCMLSVPTIRGVLIEPGHRGVAVEGDDVGRVDRVFFDNSEDVPGVGGGTGVGKSRVVIDDLVESQPQVLSEQSDGRIVVALGRIRTSRCRGHQQQQQHHRGEKQGIYRPKAVHFRPI